MELHERIRELRKNHLKMSQTAFGKKLGVSRDVIKNIELNALARPEQKLSLIKLMCKEFNVNEEWILNGTEPMFVEPDTFSLDEYVKSKGMSDFELEIVKAYFDLDPQIRSTVVSHFKKHLTEFASELTEPTEKFDPRAECPVTPEEMERLYPPVDIGDKSKKNKGVG